MPDIEAPERYEELPVAIVKNMIGLTTAGFGVVLALAWNQLVQKLVDQYISPYLGKNSGIVSLFIYAVMMTVLAVVVTMQLTRLLRKVETIQEKVRRRGGKNSQLEK